MAKLNMMRETQSTTQEGLDALLPSVLDKAFKGEWRNGNKYGNKY